MTILPSTYLGSVEYFARLLREECTIDLGEHYVKRSERNRAQIMTANGVMALTVNLCKANRPRVPVKDIRIDYSKRWQHLHRTAILSAYRSTPYFDHYADALMPFYERRFDFLADYNAEITDVLLRLARIDARPAYSDTYIVAGEGDDDLRAKKRESAFVSPEYFQSFGDRMAFVPNLSFADLLFSEGPNATDVLRHCRW